MDGANVAVAGIVIYSVVMFYVGFMVGKKATERRMRWLLRINQF